MVIDYRRIDMKNVWPTDWRKVAGILGAIVAIGIVGVILWYFIPGLIRWIIEVLGYPFWVVFTKFLKIDVNQFDAFWAFVGIACIATVVVGNFAPVRISKHITTVSKKEEDTEG